MYFPFDENVAIWWHNDLVTMCLCLASRPYTICEASVVNLTALFTPFKWAGKFGNFNSVPFNRDSRILFLEKTSANAGSQTPLYERSIKVDQCVASKLIEIIF